VIHSDEPTRAARAAVQLLAAVMSLEIPQLPGIRLQTGIGITCGEVIAGNVGRSAGCAAPSWAIR
jgi:class 3 adenylate cyclase